MKKQRISDIISNLNESIIEEATVYQKSNAKASKRNVWMKWTAVAACFALMLAVGIPVLNNVLVGPDKQIVNSVWLIEYDNAYYEIIENNPKALEKFGVVTEITDDVIGGHISYLQLEHPKSERSNCIVSKETTEMELLEYKPANNKAHRVFRNGEKYYIARFCNYLNPDDVSYPVNAALEVYGVDGASDIKGIAPTSTDNTWNINGTTITDKSIIATFYHEIIHLKHYSEQEHHELVFAEDLKSAEGKNGGDIGTEIYTKHADDLNVLVIETVEGIRFTIGYYPSYGWIYFSETQTYCKMTTEMAEWIENNIR